MNKLGLPKITFAQKLIMGSIIGHTIDYWGVGVQRGTYPAKIALGTPRAGRKQCNMAL